MTELGEFAMYLAYGFIGLGFLFGPIGVAIGRRIGGQAGRPADAAEMEEMVMVAMVKKRRCTATRSPVRSCSAGSGSRAVC